MMKKASYLTSLFLAPVMHLAAADQAAPTPGADQGLTQTLVMVAIAIAFFYFILWRPEQKRRKALEAQRSGMKKGDRAICMGIVGTISKIKEDTIVLKTAGTEIEFLKAAVSEVQPTATAGTEEERKES